MIPSRDEAWQLVADFTQSESLRRHMLAVEAAMRAYASRFGGDPELWGVVGLLHDFDYERYPTVSADGHPVRGSEILRERGVDETIITAILAHAPEITAKSPETSLEKALFAVDELTGLRERPNVARHAWMTPAQILELGDIVRIRQKTDVENKVAVGGDAMAKAKTVDVDYEFGRFF